MMDQIGQHLQNSDYKFCGYRFELGAFCYVFVFVFRENIHLHYVKDDPLRMNLKKCHIILLMCFLLSTAPLKEKYIK